MISLFLDSCDKKIIVALLKDNKLIYSKIEENDNHLSERFLPMIKDALDEVEYSLNDVNRIYIVNGPGSFTGIRVGVVTAKVIAWGLKKEIIPISELEVVSSAYSDKKYNVPYIDARRDYVYAGMYDNNLNQVFEDVYISKEKLLNKIRRHSKLDEYQFVSYDKLFENTMYPSIDIEKIVEKHQNDIGLNPHDIVPNYLKRTEAEEKNDRSSK